MYKAWNLLLIILTFLLTLLGTMMTRSGVVQSVHAFAQSDIGGFFLPFIVFTAVVSLGLLIYRLPELRPEHQLESVVSREFAFLANNWVLLAAAVFVTFATLFPSLFKGLTGQEVNVGPSFFNLWMIPIGLVLLFLTGVGPLLSWRKSTGRTLWDQFWIPSLLGVIASGALRAWGVNAWEPLVTLGLCTFVTATLGQEFWRGARHRMRKSQESAVTALATLVQRAKRRYGGYVVHFGVVLMFVGFAGNSFKVEKEVQVTKGETVEIGGYSLRLEGLRFRDDGQKNMVTANLTVMRRDSGAELGTLEPAKWFYRKPEEQVTSEVDKLSSLPEDLYVVLGGFDARNQQAALQLKVNPLVNFVWLGCGFLMLGFGIAIWPDRRSAPAPALSWARVAPAASAASLLLGFVSAALAFLG